MQLLGEGMDTDILIRNLTIGFNEALGYITVLEEDDLETMDALLLV